MINTSRTSRWKSVTLVIVESIWTWIASDSSAHRTIRTEASSVITAAVGDDYTEDTQHP